MDKIDRDFPKGTTTTQPGCAAYLGNFRAHKDNAKDEFHVHDDANSLVFRMAQVRGFDMAARAFLYARHRFWDNQSVLFPGIADDPGSGRKACDLVFSRNRNSWNASLAPCGTCSATHVARMSQEIIDLCDFANGLYGDDVQVKINGMDVSRNKASGEVRVTENGLMFRMGNVKGPKDEIRGPRRFQMAIRRATDSLLSYPEDAVLVFPTDGGDDKHEPADLAIMLRPSGWTIGLFKGDAVVGSACFGDGVTTVFDEIMQRG